MLNWNVEWATARSPRAPEIRRRIDRHAPHDVCLTESNKQLLPASGHTICANADYGYAQTKGRRKVLLWSREPWKHFDDVGHEYTGTEPIPPGRYVAGITQIPLGRASVIGVCIPYAGCRTQPSFGPVDTARQLPGHLSIHGSGAGVRRSAARSVRGSIMRRAGRPLIDTQASARTSTPSMPSPR